MKKILIAALWVACGAYNYAATLAHFTENYGYMRNMSPALMTGISGPFGLPATLLIVDHPTHLLWKPLTKEQRWLIFDAEEHVLGRCYFEENYGSGEPCKPPVNDLDLLRNLEAEGKK